MFLKSNDNSLGYGKHERDLDLSLIRYFLYVSF
jgi:hypothetical protein